MKKLIKIFCLLPLFLFMFGCEFNDIKTYDEETQCLIRGEAATMASAGAAVYIDDGYKYYTGLGVYDRNSMVTLTIESIPGYYFWGLYLDGKLVTENQTYTFKAEADEYIFKAYYKKNFDYITLNYDATRGEAFGDGEYNTGDEVTITAEPFLGYDFCNWYIPNSEKNVYENPYTFKKTDNITEIYALFTENGYMSSYDFKGTKDECEIISVKEDRAIVLFVPDYVTGIKENAFSNLGDLEEVVIGSGIEKIEKNTFSNCTKLNTIILDKNITSIDNGAFDQCTSLENVYYNGTINDWCEIVLENYDSNPMLYANNFYLLDDNGLVEYYEKKYSLVTEITASPLNDFTFYGFSGLTKVTISTGTISIGESAFAYCTNLKDIFISDRITEIGKYSFQNCTKLENVILGNRVTYIEEYAFLNCSLIESIVLPNSIDSINECAFSNCEKLEKVFYKGTLSEWEYVYVGNGNDKLINSTVYYYSETTPTEPGNYWHYNSNNEIVVWS